jgi:hypothetical protein
MLREDSETECLLEELDDGAFDDRVFLVKKLVAIFHIIAALTYNECTEGCLPLGKHTREVCGVMQIMVNFLYYYCWRMVSEVHKLGWILAHRVCGLLKHATAYWGEAKLMRCEHEATLANPTQDMLMGSTRAVDLIFPLSMVASHRHQSIINMNKRLKQKNRRLHDKILIPMELKFF